jgi:hypothetical protein
MHMRVCAPDAFEERQTTLLANLDEVLHNNMAQDL